MCGSAWSRTRVSRGSGWGVAGVGSPDGRWREHSERLAEAVRFELTKGCPLPVFKTGAFNHSATLPFMD